MGSKVIGEVQMALIGYEELKALSLEELQKLDILARNKVITEKEFKQILIESYESSQPLYATMPHWIERMK